MRSRAVATPNPASERGFRLFLPRLHLDLLMVPAQVHQIPYSVVLAR
jgi:hypothetical protein